MIIGTKILENSRQEMLKRKTKKKKQKQKQCISESETIPEGYSFLYSKLYP